MNAFDELAGYRFSPGRDYDKRSVETFRARVLNLVDDLLNQVTQLQDDVADLRSREARAVEEHEAPVVPTTWLDAIAGEPDRRSVTAAVVPFPMSDGPPSPGYHGGFVRPFVASISNEPSPTETAPAAFPAPPVMAWLADLEQPPGADDAMPLVAAEPATDVDEAADDDADDDAMPRSSTADLLRSVPSPPPTPAAVDLEAELVDLTASFHATESAVVVDTGGDTDDEVLAPIVTLPVPPRPPALVTPPPPPPPPAIVVSVPWPPVTVAPPPPPPPVTAVPTVAPIAAEHVAPDPLVTDTVVPEPLVAFAPEPVGVGASVGRYERLPIVLDDGLPDEGNLPAPVRHWSGWMRD